MSAEAYVINDPPGTFRVVSPDGEIAFNSDLATQRIYMTGTADLAGVSDVNGINATTKYVDFGRTFPKIPYVRSAARQISGPAGGLVDFYPPKIGWLKNAIGIQFSSGHYTHATASGLYLGNAMRGNATLRYVYAVFENPVEA